jgi:hypothetical protein
MTSAALRRARGLQTPAAMSQQALEMSKKAA